ncbi:hypothetical protein CPAR01_01148 [Colletotrichum paranaense]|uniref:Uncharacterized protein n=1 Tax=Colletotrichum paranaense TaxID=1914294 RepID=A0ABQ9T606_9PEZI|nr:uncharacterized protein CPAR01_01148 [Colletotrichum paranaense]KAK1547181.1 hypothetical protein CPAR01_01148 [Colletotrichum paranaense]
MIASGATVHTPESKHIGADTKQQKPSRGGVGGLTPTTPSRLAHLVEQGVKYSASISILRRLPQYVPVGGCRQRPAKLTGSVVAVSLPFLTSTTGSPMALRNSKGIFAINGVVSALCYDLSTNNRERHRCGDVGALGIVAPEEGVSEATDKIRAEPTTSISKLNLWSQRVIASPSDFIVDKTAEYEWRSASGTPGTAIAVLLTGTPYTLWNPASGVKSLTKEENAGGWEKPTDSPRRFPSGR